MKNIYFKDLPIDNKDILLNLWIEYLVDIRICKNNNIPLTELQENMLYIIDEYSYYFSDKIKKLLKGE